MCGVIWLLRLPLSAPAPPPARVPNFIARVRPDSHVLALERAPIPLNFLAIVPNRHVLSTMSLALSCYGALMRAEDLNLQELLEFDPEGGEIKFAGQRALLIDAVAMGLLRKYLVDNFGLTAARTVLTQFGFAHGWRLAVAIQRQFKWSTNEDWRRAGPRLHTLEGLFRVDGGVSTR